MDDGIAAAIGGKLLNGTVVSTGYFKDNPSKGNQQFITALNKKYGDKAADLGCRRRSLGRRLHARARAEEREVDRGPGRDRVPDEREDVRAAR